MDAPAVRLVTQQPLPLTRVDARASHAYTQPYRFLVIAAQLALILGVVWVYRVEQFGFGDLDFFALCAISFAAFAIHYWLPFRWKEKFWVAVSLAGAFLFLRPITAIGLLAAGAAIYCVVASSLSYRMRVGLIVAGFFGATILRAQSAWLTNLTHGHSLNSFWPMFGAVFMFRLIIYLYDLRQIKGRPGLTGFLAYFFILPNYFFMLFPVIDYKTMRLGYYRRDIHEIAQQGIQWIVRGVVQLSLYMVVYHVREMMAMDGINTFPRLVSFMFLTFILYLRVSGQFHIIVGVLHLFGYDLPETNHKYLLSSSLNDFWRRINIYWKEFMVKVVYFPTYFKLRKKSEFRARMVATATVFIVTWALHSYQSYWLRGHFIFTWPDTLFWAILGSLVMINVWWDFRHPKKVVKTGVWPRINHALSVVGTMSMIIFIWSLWDAPSLSTWIDFLSWWHPKA